MKNIIIFFLIVNISISCSRNTREREVGNKFSNASESLSNSLFDLPILKPDSLTTIKLPEKIEDPKNDVIVTSDLIESIEYIPLETTKNSLVHSVEQSLIYNDNIYILDNFGKSILMFNKQGKFIKRIGSYGKGPKEYINPIKITLNEKSQKLYVLDDKTSKLLIYDLSGNYLSEERIKFRVNDFLFLNDSTCIVNTGTRENFHLPEIANNKLVLTDKKWKILAKGFEYDAAHCNTVSFSRNGLYRYKNQIIYNPTLSNYIYRITPFGIQPEYFIDAGKAMLPEGFDYELTFDDFFKKYDNRQSKYVYIDKPIIETDNFLITTLRYQGRILYFFYSKNTRTLFCSLYYKPKPDGLTILTPFRGISGEDEFYGFTDAIGFKREMDFVFKVTHIEMSPKLKAIKEDDNPIFIFYKLKKF